MVLAERPAGGPRADVASVSPPRAHDSRELCREHACRAPVFRCRLPPRRAAKYLALATARQRPRRAALTASAVATVVGSDSGSEQFHAVVDP